MLFAIIGDAPHRLKMASRTYKKLWDIAWEMWDHHNRVIHDKEFSVESEEVNIEIRGEWTMGGQGLPRDVQPLFHQNRKELLRNTLQYRRDGYIE
mgnify:FL=1